MKKNPALLKCRIFLIFIIFSLAVSMIAGCSPSETNNEESTDGGDFLQTTELPLELWKEEYLFENIPAPKNADVYIFTESYSEGWKIYSFFFKNFTFEEAKEYVSVLEASSVSREFYDEYHKSENPILNYVGYVNEGLAVSLSQCGEAGEMTVNIKEN